MSDRFVPFVFMALRHRTASLGPPKYEKKKHTSFYRSLTDGSAILMNPSKGETSVLGFHCQRNMAVRMRKVMARPWVALTLAVRGFWDASFPRSGSNGNGFATLPLAV